MLYGFTEHQNEGTEMRAVPQQKSTSLSRQNAAAVRTSSRDVRSLLMTVVRLR